MSATIELSSLNGTNGFVLNGIDAGDRSGRSVASAGDVNGDGFDDLIIGAIGGDPAGQGYAGETYVVFGQAGGFAASLDLSSLNGTNGFVLNGIDAYDFSGASVASAGDVNGDGFDDLIIGAPSADPAGQGSAGETYVVFGRADGFAASLDLPTLNGTNGFVLNGIDARDRSGFSVASAGDVNGDGIDDLIIGADRADPNGQSYAGESYVVFGQAGGFAASLDLSALNGSNGFVLNGIDTNDYSGRSVASAGDVNGDGFDDLIIGAYRAGPNGQSYAGESYVVFGQAGGFAASLDLSALNGSNGFVLNGIDTNDYSGRSVASAGDVNGDGFDDLIIGAYRAGPNGQSYAGQSYVVFGQAGGFAASLDLSSLNGTNGFVLNGIDANDFSGFSVASAGDVNGDGFDDLIIGAYRADPAGGTSAGESYVVFGQAGGFAASLDLSLLNGSNGFVLNGIDVGDASGFSVAGAGDVNGDGFDDLIIGAYRAGPNGQSYAGESYVVFGSADFGAPPNTAPVAGDDTASTDEDTAIAVISVLTNDSDPDASDVLTVTGFNTTGTLGIVIDEGFGNFSYDPNGAFESLAPFETATDSFTYTVSDGNGGFDTATVTITINGQGDVPVVTDETVTTDEDTAIAVIDVLANDFDIDASETLTATLVQVFGFGIVTDNGNGTFSYDPNGAYEALSAGESVIEQFTYLVLDSNGLGNSGTVTIVVNGVNDAPIANDVAASTLEDVAISIGGFFSQGNFDDVDQRDSHTVSFDTTGTRGLVTDNGDGTFSYDPNGAFNSLAENESATDSFTYTVSDGNGGTDTATVTITIEGDNDAPVVVDTFVSTNEDTPIVITPNVSDVDASDVLQFDILFGSGGLVFDNGDGTFTYDPTIGDGDIIGLRNFQALAAGETDFDFIQYTVTDSAGPSFGVSGAIIIEVIGVNDAPVANDITFDITGVDGPFITGLLRGFSLGGLGSSNFIDVDVSDVHTVSFDTTGTFGQVTDFDFGGLEGFSYDPNGAFDSLAPGEIATDSFTYTVSDGNGGTDTATITITFVVPGGDGPVANNDTATIGEDDAIGVIAVLANDSGENASDVLTVSAFDTTGTIGLVTDNGDGTFAYDPNGAFEALAAGETATDSFTYTVSDGNGGTDTATVTITINGANDAPVANNDTASTDENTAISVISVLANDADADASDVLAVFAFDTTGTIGLVNNNGDGTFAYDPNGAFEALAAGETATDSFTYTVSDGNGGTDTATVTITINGANDAPVAADDTASTDENTAVSVISVLANDADADASDVLAVFAFDTTGTIGLVTNNGDGTFAYDPNGAFDSLAAGETATDSFNYTVSDGNGGTDTATVTITINGANDAPVANNDTASTDENTAIAAIAVLANDADVDASDELTVFEFDTTGTLGLVTDNGDGTFAYDPNGAFDSLAAGETATDSFTYTVSDGNGGTDTASVTITITGAGSVGTITGTSENDTLTGTDLAELMLGLGGDDSITGGRGNDTIDGGTGRDLIRGGNGLDLIRGGDGVDTLFGEIGNDTIEGGFGNDQLDGAAGNDRLVGGRATDRMNGGNGDDTFVFSFGDGTDTVADFDARGNDVIELSGFGAAFDTFAEVLGIASVSGAAIRLNFGGSDTLILNKTTLASLTADDFIFA